MPVPRSYVGTQLGTQLALDCSVTPLLSLLRRFIKRLGTQALCRRQSLSQLKISFSNETGDHLSFRRLTRLHTVGTEGKFTPAEGAQVSYFASAGTLVCGRGPSTGFCERKCHQWDQARGQRSLTRRRSPSSFRQGSRPTVTLYVVAAWCVRRVTHQKYPRST
jgi:hypothetical protein